MLKTGLLGASTRFGDQLQLNSGAERAGFYRLFNLDLWYKSLSKSSRTLLKISAFLVFLCLVTASLWAIDCPSCGKTGIPELRMICPQCGETLRKPVSGMIASESAILTIEVKYTGDDISILPDYGKIFINQKYRENIPLVEKEARDKIGIETKKTGIGADYTAIYKAELRGFREGVYDVMLEFRFPRWFEWAKNKREIAFNNLGLKKGQRTSIFHTFSSVPDFPVKKTTKASTVTPSEVKPYSEPGKMGIEIPLTK
ncbi:MAG: hypothetical protein HQM08_09080 [Candidatus Riflebacteria bacterium]|nr:hypothetical protein [Candidatus Riflebacteria bacterium]